jgi:hypothetical protein
LREIVECPPGNGIIALLKDEGRNAEQAELAREFRNGPGALYSHNANDPLHRDNLPEWCGGVTALDSFDVVAILVYGGNRKKALAELTQRFGLAKNEER